jgi:electron transfer flavoprotein alpha/beta subunit
MQAILGAGKKPCQILSASDIGITPDQTDSLIRSVRTMGNIPDRKKIFLTGEPKVSADEAVRLLMAEGVI